MLIDGALHKVFAAPEEPNVADSNRRLQHVAPPETLVFGLPSVSINIRLLRSYRVRLRPGCAATPCLCDQNEIFQQSVRRNHEHSHLPSWIREDPGHQRCLRSTKAVNIHVSAGVAAGEFCVESRRRRASQFK